MTMKYTVHVAITTDEGQTEIREIASVEREDLTPYGQKTRNRLDSRVYAPAIA
jgi:hypothetical protein